MTQAIAAAGARPRLGRREWGVLALTLMFWLFDGYEVYALILTMIPALHSLLPAADLKATPRYAGYLVSATLFGWATGGILGGVFGDKIGRKKTMILAILVYAVFTGTSALVQSWGQLALTRFLTGVGIGAEWGVGTSLLAESWPAAYRTKGAGLLQSGFSLGAFAASGIWWWIGGQMHLSWRWIYVIGILPALVVFLTARRIPESYRWTQAHRRGESIGVILRGRYGRHLIVALLVSISITVGWWAISSWVPSYVGQIAARTGGNVAYYSGIAGLLYNAGEIAGCILFGFLADAWGRKPTAFVFFAGSLIITPVVFLWVHDLQAILWLQLANGFLTSGLYSWYTIQPPELFPTAARATAISVIFNGARYLAMFGPIVASMLIQAFGGYSQAATAFGLIYILGALAVLFLPETKGKALPD
ncbi:MFS transporter [Alicyclobacillus sp.]|uniref:MFS transporter n=1 Tax=Alicyclobacillus sp. TaxID=61169 RepID=UPI0025C5A8C3|nr:MFS transporter [Alicyclobacillus sp.]MCL6517565.1 MFS transporter [Alicyclobacillus sp.]